LINTFKLLGVTKMFHKKTLGVALAAVFASSAANAVIDFDNALAPGKVAFAKETLLTTATTTGTADLATYYNVVGAGTALSAAGATEVGVSADNQIFVRYDFDSSVLSAAAPALTTSGGAFSQSVAQGGAIGADFVIYTLTATAAMAQTDVLTIPLVGHAISGTTGANISMAVYETLTNASNEVNPLTNKTVSAAISAGSGFAASVVKSVATAEVESGFTQWANGDLANLTNTLNASSITPLTATVVRQVDGAGVILTDMFANVAAAANSTQTYTGDFATGTAYFLDSDGDLLDCNTTSTALTPAVDELTATTFTANIGIATASSKLCMTVDGLTVIPESSFTLTTTLVPVPNAAFPAVGAADVDAGIIDHNGTTVHLAYLTTWMDYNQRLVMVNRGNSPAGYTVTFTTEAGVTATPGTAATGTLGAGESTMVKVTDIVTLTGGTRTAATLVVVSPNANIDVATTQVNLADGGTDTVKYK
jgi:hypothetical protein